MTIETIADTVKQLQNKYDETDPFRLAKAMKITVKLRPMGIYEGCCKGFFSDFTANETYYNQQ